MSKFVFAFYKKDAKKHLMKVVIDGVNNDDEIWAETTKAVHDFAKKNFEENEECGFEYEEVDGKYKISKILKGKGTTKTAKKTETKKEAKYICEDCGKALKDGKYKKCYTCNQKNPVKKISKKTNSTGDFRSPEQITKDYLANSTAQVVNGALVGMTGQLNPNNAKEVTLLLMEEVYKKFQALVG